MDTAEVAELLGTTPRVLRQFLRSPVSTFVAVGSGARYEFNDRDVPTIKKRFADWNSQGKPKPIVTKPKAQRSQSAKLEAQHQKDVRVWEEEGSILLEDIRDPRVRRRVQLAAQAAEARLNMRLMAVGLHITQLGDRESA